jgi:hypothetical protein
MLIPEFGLSIGGEEEGTFIFFSQSVSSEKSQDDRDYLLHGFEQCQLAKLESLPLAGLREPNLGFKWQVYIIPSFKFLDDPQKSKELHHI